MTRFLLLAAAALSVLAVGAAGPGLVEEAHGGDRVQVVVALEAPPLAHAPDTGARIAAEQRAFRSALARELPEASTRWRYRLVANGFAVALPESQLSRLLALPGVRDVYESAGYEPQLDATPQAIGAPGLWGANLATAGQGVKIGIIDTGIDQAHPFFDPAGYAMPAGFPKGQTRFTNAKVIVARAFPPPTSQNPRAGVPVEGDNSSHGTHVAGIAAGNTRTQASGGRVVSGVAPRAYLGNYKALVGTDSGLSPNGNAPELVAAIEAAVRDGMDVINLSIGEPEIEPLRDAVALALDAAARAGVVSVVAAGNDFNDLGAGTVSSPANSAAAITVAAFETAGSGPGTHADFSSVGPTAISLRQKPDVAAPGVNVLSSVPEGWLSQSGTSMASPHVAGAAALLVQRHPAWSPAQVKSALVQSGNDGRVAARGVPGPEYQGGGIVALGKADAPILFADPTGVSFGLVGRSARVRAQVRLTDAGSGAGAWQLSVTRRGGPAGSRVSVPASVTVPGTLTIQAVTARNARQGTLSGYAELRRGGDVRRVPYWGRVAVPGLARHRPIELRRAGLYRGTTRGRPARAIAYRYPDSPSGLGVTQSLRGPEAVYRFRLRQRVANFGVVITSRARGSGAEPRVVSRMDENRLTGYGGLPFANNPYLEDFRRPLLVAGAIAPLPGEYGIVFDSGSRAGAGAFTFRFWINDVSPPTLRLRTRSVASGSALSVAARDPGAGVYPESIRATIDGQLASTSFGNGVIRVETGNLPSGQHRLRLRVSDYQETKNTENVARILQNTRTFTATFRVR